MENLTGLDSENYAFHRPPRKDLVLVDLQEAPREGGYSEWEVLLR